MTSKPRILVTGATGYIGGRLVPRLLADGYAVRVLARDPSRLEGRSWRKEVEAIRGDALDASSLRPALAGASAAYYLIHSMGAGDSFHQEDLRAARNFGQAAVQTSLGRIIYLGGLGIPESNLSEHLRSRQATGAALREAGVPVTELRAGIVVGAGSISFEMIRNLTERIPIMVAPRWVRTRTQPIAIDDLLGYLVAALDTPPDEDAMVEIGGNEILTYGELLMGYARVRGLRRFILPVPVLTPRLSSYWVHWMTPISSQMARPLIDGLKSEAIVRDDRARELFPEIHPMPYEQAVERALGQLQADQIETAWSDSLASTARGDGRAEFMMREGMILERRRQAVAAAPARVYDVFSRLGGERGWLYADWLWRLRGAIDRALGGVGLRRGRRSQIDIRPGDAIDFWRVEAVEPGSYLRLRAEMRLPGQSWLEFKAEPRTEDNESSLLSQTVYYAPKGLAGLLVWYLLYPFHNPVFSGMIRAIANHAESWRGAHVK